LLLLPLFPLSSAMADPLPHPSQDAADRLMQMLASVQASQATFTEVKVMANLTRPLQDSGRLTYRRPSHLEKVTVEPLAERLVVDGDRLTLAEGGAAPRVIDLNAEPVIRGLVDAIRGTLSGDLALLRRAYQVSMQGDVSAWRLILIPTDPSVAQLIVSTTIEGTGTSLRVVQTRQTNGDDTRMTITPIS
jgi:outer membrane lipoprotein-sorting protein